MAIPIDIYTFQRGRSLALVNTTGVPLPVIYTFHGGASINELEAPEPPVIVKRKPVVISLIYT